MNIAKLKASARKNLAGNYPTMILVLLVFVLLGGCCLSIASLINTKWMAYILMVIAYSLIAMGLVDMVVKISKKGKVKFEDLLSKTDLFFKYIGITIVLWFIGMLFSLLEVVAFKSLVVVITYQADLNIFIAVLLIVFGLLLCAGILVAAIYISIAFSQVFFVLNDEPKSSVKNILSKSFDMMGDYAGEYFMLVLSFIGWIILGLFTFGILYLWLIPYMLVTFANFYKAIKKEYDEVSSEPEPIFSSSIKDEEIETLF